MRYKVASLLNYHQTTSASKYYSYMSSAVAEMAAQCCTSRTVKKIEKMWWVSFGATVKSYND